MPDPNWADERARILIGAILICMGIALIGMLLAAGGHM